MRSRRWAWRLQRPSRGSLNWRRFARWWRQGSRLQRLEDIQAIERLQRAYGNYADKNLWDQVVDLFAEESSVELDQRGVFLDKTGVRRMFL